MKRNYFFIFSISVLLFFSSLSLMGQRKMEILDRGVVAMPTSSSKIYVSWRHFATDPDEIAYNLYYKTSEAGALTKLNNSPITNSTNFTANLSTSNSDYTFVVKSVLNGIEKDEPGSFTVKKNTVASRIVQDINFEPLPTKGFPSNADLKNKFIWPADIDADGKYDFIIDRQNYGQNFVGENDYHCAVGDPLPHFVEAYSSEGEFLWRVAVGKNVKPCNGDRDMITAYDMDGDGKAEVIMAVSEGAIFADGTVLTGANGTITDYYRSQVNGAWTTAPQWVAILDGQTGNLIDTIPLPLTDKLFSNRGDEERHYVGNMVIAYLDGINPALVYQYRNRTAGGTYQVARAAFDFKNGKLRQLWADNTDIGGSQFHQVRVADVDGDGKDEFVDGSFVADDDGTLTHYGTGHGDRHCIADIDPDRPGLEHFFIQQSSLMGMGLADPVTGEIIKGFYMGSVIDVGRGVAGAFDTRERGMQFFSTINSMSMYDSKGKATGSRGTSGYNVGEALWFGKDLSRAHIVPINSTGSNIDLFWFNVNTNTFERPTSGTKGRRLYLENNGNGEYYFGATDGGRAAFWGDLYGDWREEIILRRTGGFVIISTDEETDIRLYTLMQNPAYRGQTTTRGYYQTADTDYYMAWDMPAPPISPVQKADLYYNGSAWIDYDNNSGTYADGKSIMFDIRGGNSTYSLNGNMAPSRLYLINPKGADYTFNGAGKFTGSMDVIKSLQGDVTFNGNYDYTGITRISEGRLFVNGKLESKVQLDARGVIGGNAVLNGGIVLETGLNVEGARIEPGYGTTLGKLTIVGNVNFPGRNNIAFDVDQTKAELSDLVEIQGNFTVTGNNHSLVIKPVTDIQPGIISLITFTGTTNATSESFEVKGLEGIPYDIIVENNGIKLKISQSRSAGEIQWNGDENDIWDFRKENFLNAGLKDNFIPGDAVTFNDNAVSKTVTVNESLPVGNITFSNDGDYILQGDGVLTGTSGLTKTGKGKLTILLEENTFTGPITVENSTLEIASLGNSGLSSSIGAATGEASNWVMKNSTLQAAKGVEVLATDRNLTVQDTLTINNPSGGSIVFNGDLQGNENSVFVQGGAGSVVITGTLTDFSDVIIKDGKLSLGSTSANLNALADKSPKITLLGGVFDMANSQNFYEGKFENEIHVPEGAKTQWNIPFRWSFSNKLTGSGEISIYNRGARGDLAGDFSEFTGKITFAGDGAELRFRSKNMYNLAKADVVLSTGGSLNTNSTDDVLQFGSLSGSSGIAGGRAIIVGAKGINSTYNGVIASGDGTMKKIGSGMFTLTGANLYTGGTTVEEGTLVASNPSVSPLGTGSVLVKDGATLMIKDVVSGTVNLSSGATLIAGTSETSTGTMKLGNALRAVGNPTIVVKVSKFGADIITVAENITLAGTLEMRELASGVFKAGASYNVFNSTGGTISGTFETVIPEKPGDGLAWDLSSITEGIIKIVSEETGIINPKNNIAADVYPAIVDNTCYVDFREQLGEVRVELINQIGVVFTSEIISSDRGPYKLDMNNCESGFYFIRLSANGKQTVCKVIKR